MSYTQAVGIDLGTTYSAVARLDEAGRTVMVRNGQGDLLTPSVVLFDDDEIVVGRDAKKALATDPDRVADCAKRNIGHPSYARLIRGRHLPPEVIQSCILRRLKQDVIDEVGADFKTVVTVPAYFDELRRTATANAAEMAGLALLDIVNEPTAAALAFGEQLGYLDAAGCVRQPMKVLVYDLGGGTFDVTLIDLAAGSFRTQATDGDVQLGGRDWDARLRDYAANEFVERFQKDPRHDIAALSRLDRACEEAKHTLSARDRTDIHVEYAGQACDVPVTRAQFEDLTADLLERTAYTTRQVLSGCRVEWRDVSFILLVGGSTRMPMVARRLRELSGLEPAHSVNADEAVARGAAIFAGYLLAKDDPGRPGARFRVVDVNSHSLGIEGIDPETRRKQNYILIPRNTPLPCRVQEQFLTKTPGQQSVIVQVLEGENAIPDQCTRVARAVLRNLPPNLPQGWPIEVSYEYHTNGRVRVAANVAGSDNRLAIELQREGGLTGEGLARWKQLLSTANGFQVFANVADTGSSSTAALASAHNASLLAQPGGLISRRPDDRPAGLGSKARPNALPRPTPPTAGPTPASSNAPASSSTPSSGNAPAIRHTPAGGINNPPAGQLGAAPALRVSADQPITISTGSSHDGYEIKVDEPQATPQTVAKDAAADRQDAADATSPAIAGAKHEPNANAATEGKEPESDPAPDDELAIDAVRPRRRKTNSSARAVVNLVAHLMSSVIGLSLGYYILCWLSPESNFLHLKLPGLPEPPAAAAPAQAPGAGSTP